MLAAESHLMSLHGDSSKDHKPEEPEAPNKSQEQNKLFCIGRKDLGTWEISDQTHTSLLAEFICKLSA